MTASGESWHRSQVRRPRGSRPWKTGLPCSSMPATPSPRPVSPASCGASRGPGGRRGRRRHGRGGHRRHRRDRRGGHPRHPGGAAQRRARVVVVVTRVDDGGLLAALEAGACGIVRRAEARSDRLVAAVRAAVAGDGTVPPDLLGRLLDQIGRLQRQVLAPRPRQRRPGRAGDRGPTSDRGGARHQRDRRSAVLLGAHREERHPRRHPPAAAAQPVARSRVRHASGWSDARCPDIDVAELERQVERGTCSPSP